MLMGLFSSFIGKTGVILVGVVAVIGTIFYFYNLGAELTECKLKTIQLTEQIETMRMANEIQDSINKLPNDALFDKLRREWGRD